MCYAGNSIIYYFYVDSLDGRADKASEANAVNNYQFEQSSQTVNMVDTNTDVDLEREYSPSLHTKRFQDSAKPNEEVLKHFVNVSQEGKMTEV